VDAQLALAEAQAARIRTLQGLLPIRVVCKKVKNDRGCRKMLESYPREHSGADLSHSLGPEGVPACLEKCLPGTRAEPTPR